MVDKSPGQGEKKWIEAQAWDLPTLWGSISKHHPKDHPVSIYMMLVIFFEETAFCNMRQLGDDKGKLGVGFGQLEISNVDKEPFYEWLLGKPTDYETVAKMMLADNDFAVKTHCSYFQWLISTGQKQGLEGCLGAQVGDHVEYQNLFIKGATLLKKAMGGNDRIAYARALNYARANSTKGNGHGNNIPIEGESKYEQFWKFILPDTYFSFGY